MAFPKPNKLAAMQRALKKSKRLEEPREKEDHNETASQEREEESTEL